MLNVFLSSQFASTAAGAQHHSHQKKFDSTAMVVPMQGTEKSVIFQSLNSGDHKQCSLVIGRDARAVYNGGLYSSDQFDLTPENVDKVLEDVLPYLIADSGNVDAEFPHENFFKLLQFWANAAIPTSVTSRQPCSFSRVRLRQQKEIRING
nr:nifU-like protein 1, chloroplastic [Ipomoea batatas]